MPGKEPKSASVPPPGETQEPNEIPAIWLFKMTFNGEEITFDRVSLDFNNFKN
jgi:hypothetical protein